MKCNFRSAVCVIGLVAAAGAYAVEPEMLKLGGEGKIAIVNTCDAPTTETEAGLNMLGNLLMINFEITKGNWSLAEAQKCFDATKANVAVFLVKDKSLPLSLIAMEAKWGVVNTEGLDSTSISKEVLRVTTVVLGGAASKYTASSMRPVFSKEDLEKKAGKIVTFDSIMAISTYLPDLGIKPYRMMTREEAIDEGLIKTNATVSAEAKK